LRVLTTTVALRRAEEDLVVAGSEAVGLAAVDSVAAG
jgi:hypothetical protein